MNGVQTAGEPDAGASAGWKTVVLWEDDDSRLELTTRAGGAATLVVTFDPIAVLAQQPAYAGEFMRKCGVDVLALRKKREHFYQPLSREQFVRHAAPVLRRYRRRVAYGSSLGAYAALYYARDGFDLVVASSPRISAHPRFGTTYWRDRIDFHHEAFDPQLPATSGAVVFYDPCDAMDRGLVEDEILPAWPGARRVPVPYAGHPANHFLAEIGYIAPFMRAVVAGTTLPAAPSRALKASSPSYLATLAGHCLRRGKPRWARDLAARALPRRAADITVVRTLGLAELAAGDPAAAIPLLQRVADRYPHDLEAVDALERALARQPGAARGAPAPGAAADNPPRPPQPAASTGAPSMTREDLQPSHAADARDSADTLPRRLRRWAKSNAVGPASSVLSKVGLMVSRDDVLWCYRHLLGREPESEEAVLSHLRFRDFRALVDHFVSAPEYAGRRGITTAGTGRATKRPPRIGADAFRAAIERSMQGRPVLNDVRVYVETHFDRLLHTINVIDELMPASGRMIDFSAARFFSHAMDELVPRIAQTSVTGVNFERDDYVEKFGRERYDLCLNTEVLEHLLFDPAHMIFAINRMLRPGGLLFLTTPNALSMANALQLMQGSAPTLWNQVKPDEPYYERHNRDWTPFEVSTLLEEHGFEILEVYTQDFYGSTHKLLMRHPQHIDYLRRHSSHDYFGDTLGVIARKREAVAGPVRNPWLYAFHERPAPAARPVPAKKAAPKPPAAKSAPARAAAKTAASRPAAARPESVAARTPAKTAPRAPAPNLKPALKSAAAKTPAAKKAALAKPRPGGSKAPR